MDDCSKDVISHILSFLTTKEAASTSVLAKRWRYLFALVPNLDFDDDFSEPGSRKQMRFISFVNRVLNLRGEKDQVNKFSLKCGNHDRWRDDVSSWISEVLRRGVSDLTLHLQRQTERPSEIFESETLVRLEIGPGYGPEYGPRLKLEKVCLPKLETLILDTAEFEEGGIGFAKLLSGCPVLEVLGLRNLAWNYWDFGSVSSNTLKTLVLRRTEHGGNPKSVSFDTPNVVYLEYFDNIAHEYPIVNLDSLVEALIGIRRTRDQNENVRKASDGDEETEMGANVAVLLKGICNVKTLYLSDETLEILNVCCEAIPVFNNLTQLTIQSDELVGWESLPHLLNNSPNLETLVFQGFHHRATVKCGDVCVCRDSEKSPSSLSQCPVKFLMILNFGGPYGNGKVLKMRKLGGEMENIKHFLKKMPNLVQLIINCSAPIEAEVSSQLHNLEEVASRKCTIKVTYGYTSFISNVPTFLSKQFELLQV